MALRHQHLSRRARGMVVLLSEPFLVSLRRGALLSGVAVRGPAACAQPAGADRGLSCNLPRSHAGARGLDCPGVQLVDHGRPDALQAGWPGAGRASGGYGAPAGRAGSPRACFAGDCGGRRGPRRRNFRLDGSGVAPGPGAGGIGSGGAVPSAARLPDGLGHDRSGALGHLALLPQPHHGVPGHL